MDPFFFFFVSEEVDEYLASIPCRPNKQIAHVARFFLSRPSPPHIMYCLLSVNRHDFFIGLRAHDFPTSRLQRLQSRVVVRRERYLLHSLCSHRRLHPRSTWSKEDLVHWRDRHGNRVDFCWSWGALCLGYWRQRSISLGVSPLSFFSFLLFVFCGWVSHVDVYWLVRSLLPCGFFFFLSTEPLWLRLHSSTHQPLGKFALIILALLGLIPPLNSSRFHRIPPNLAASTADWCYPSILTINN